MALIDRGKLKERYKIVVLNDNSFEEKWAIKISVARLLLWGIILSMSLLIVIAILLTNSNLLQTEASLRRKFMKVHNRADSLEKLIVAHEQYILNLQNVLNGKLDIVSIRNQPNVNFQKQNIDKTNPKRPLEDFELRKLIEHESSSLHKAGVQNQLHKIHLSIPIIGVVSKAFDESKKRYGVFISSSRDAKVYAVLEGKIIFADYSDISGYTVVIKHGQGMFSCYKHCAKLFKKVNNFVKKGEMIATIGNRIVSIDKPHLYFELWNGATPLNPQCYIVFAGK